MSLRIFRLVDVRNRAYVVDLKGNKLFFGTVYQCNKFINHIKEELPDAEIDRMDSYREAERKSMVQGKATGA